jgi:hypothetical protein
MGNRFRVVVTAAAAFGLGGCAGGGDDAPSAPVPAGTSAATPAATGRGAPAGGGDGTGGIGASAARTGGVFSGPYDAALRGPSRATAGRITLRLVNVGTKRDSYRITVRPAGAATLTPATASLAPGAAAALDLRLTADASVHVVSTGRGGEVADLPLRLG